MDFRSPKMFNATDRKSTPRSGEPQPKDTGRSMRRLREVPRCTGFPYPARLSGGRAAVRSGR